MLNEVNILSAVSPVDRRLFLRKLAEATEKYFENPDVKERFEKWKAEKNAQNEM